MFGIDGMNDVLFKRTINFTRSISHLTNPIYLIHPSSDFLFSLRLHIQNMKKVLFVDRDGTLINEAPPTYQIDAFEKLSFYPDAITYMRRIATEFDYELIMVSNQDGLGTAIFS